MKDGKQAADASAGDLAYRPSPDVATRIVDDEMVLVDLEGGVYFSLDAVGVLIWQAMSEGASVSDIVDRILQAYDVDRETAEADTRRLLDELCEAKLVVAADKGA